MYQIKLKKRDHSIVVRRVKRTVKLKHSGNRGPSGQITVGSTTTLAPGTPASVTNTGTPTSAVLEFAIPQGDKGDKGDIGTSTFVRVNHGSDANVARPDALYVEWVGSVAPLNATEQDTWIRTQ